MAGGFFLGSPFRVSVRDSRNILIFLSAWLTRLWLLFLTWLRYSVPTEGHACADCRSGLAKGSLMFGCKKCALTYCADCGKGAASQAGASSSGGGSSGKPPSPGKAGAVAQRRPSADLAARSAEALLTGFLWERAATDKAEKRAVDKRKDWSRAYYRLDPKKGLIVRRFENAAVRTARRLCLLPPLPCICRVLAVGCKLLFLFSFYVVARRATFWGRPPPCPSLALSILTPLLPSSSSSSFLMHQAEEVCLSAAFGGSAPSGGGGGVSFADDGGKPLLLRANSSRDVGSPGGGLSGGDVGGGGGGGSGGGNRSASPRAVRQSIWEAAPTTPRDGGKDHDADDADEELSRRGSREKRTSGGAFSAPFTHWNNIHRPILFFCVCVSVLAYAVFVRARAICHRSL